MGLEPIQVLIDRQLLTFLGNILQNDNTIEFRIIARQLCMANSKQQSFIAKVQTILDKYHLPRLEDLLEDKPPKKLWKKMIRKALDVHLDTTMQEEKEARSTLKHMDNRSVRSAHPIWKYLPNNTLEVRKAEVKAKIITRTYTLQSDRSKFANGHEDSTCQICNNGIEDTKHFLLNCTSLSIERQKFMAIIKQYINTQEQYNCFEKLNHEGLLLKLILEPTSTELKPFMRRMKINNFKELEGMTRTLCYGLHTRRATLFNAK